MTSIIDSSEWVTRDDAGLTARVRTMYRRDDGHSRSAGTNRASEDGLCLDGLGRRGRSVPVAGDLQPNESQCRVCEAESSVVSGRTAIYFERNKDLSLIHI